MKSKQQLEQDRNHRHVHVWEFGKLAYRAGLRREDCPFVKKSLVREWWLRGWAAACADAMREVAQ